MKKGNEQQNAVKLKKAKRAVRLNYWFRIKIPHEFHCMIVNLECCTKAFLADYIINFPLSEEARKLLIEKYYEKNPALIISYLVLHFRYCPEMIDELIQRKNLDIFQKLAIISKDRWCPFVISHRQIQKLIALNDTDYFTNFCKISLDKGFSSSEAREIIELQNARMLDTFFNILEKKKSEIFIHDLQLMLIKQNNNEMIDCFLRHYRFDAGCIAKIIVQHNFSLLKKILQRPAIWEDSLQCVFAQNCTSEELAEYIKKNDLKEDAQIKLIRRNDKDLIKQYEINKGFCERAIVFYTSLQSFRQACGIV